MNPDKIENFCSCPCVAEEDKINLLDLLLVLAKHSKMIFGFCLVTFVLTLGITLLMPDIYSATTRILPLQNANGAMAEGSAISNRKVYVSILKSRPIADAIIDKFDLMGESDRVARNQVYQALEKHVSISEGKNNHIISITVEDNDPKRAAGMANAYVEGLNKHSDKNRFNDAAALRQFFEGRLETVKEDLTRAEQKLQAFQENNKAIRIDDQTKATIEAIAKIQGELTSKEIQLGVATPSQNQQTEQDVVLRVGLENLKTQVSALEQSPVGEKNLGDVSLVTSTGSGLGLQYAGLLRDFRMQVTLFELLTRQYEVARIEEMKNPPRIHVLEKAFPPAKKSKPKRIWIVLLSTLIACFLAVLAVFVRECGKCMCDEDRQRWEAIKALFLGQCWGRVKHDKNL